MMDFDKLLYSLVDSLLVFENIWRFPYLYPSIIIPSVSVFLKMKTSSLLTSPVYEHLGAIQKACH